LNLPDIGFTLFTPIKGRIEVLLYISIKQRHVQIF
jgi:hypothetical protein